MAPIGRAGGTQDTLGSSADGHPPRRRAAAR